MSNDTQADQIVNSIDTFVTGQVPDASEIIFSYTKPDDSGYKVKVLSVYSNSNPTPVQGSDLHSKALESMESYLGEKLALLLTSAYVINLPLTPESGKFAVALHNSIDRAEVVPAEESTGYYGAAPYSA